MNHPLDKPNDPHAFHLAVETQGESHVFIPAPAEREERISELLRRGGFPLNTRCGGRGLCDGCLIDLVEGSLLRIDPAQPTLSHAPSTLQACQHRLNSHPATIKIPLRSSLKHQPQIVSDYQICISAAHDPLFREIHIPKNSSARSLTAYVRQLHPDAPVRLAENISDTISPADELYVSLELRSDHWLVSAVSKTPATALLGAAIDIGTTTVALMLVDLSNGQVLGRTSRYNEQMHLGDDVLTRINVCFNNPEMLQQLQRAVATQTILPLLLEALEQAEAGIDNVRSLSIAGNTTMLHILAGVDPSSIGVYPFTPTFLDHQVISGSEIFHDPKLAHLACHLLPGAAAYVGADLTGGVIATGMIYDEGPCLLVDVGTNGEIILKHGNDLIGCATAAGPAFEGARLSSGMRASDGAISHITIDQTALKCESIGGPHSTLIGICGSAYVDFLATAHADGLLSDTGRFNRRPDHPLNGRLLSWNGTDIAFRLAYAPGKQPIVISQHDVASLMQAKAAIAAGILTLLDQRGLKPKDLKTVYLAGGFGTHLDRRAAIACGMLPGFDYDQVLPVGNTSLAGAYLSLMDSGLLNEIARASKGVRAIELNLDPDFESRFIDQLSLAPM